MVNVNSTEQMAKSDILVAGSVGKRDIACFIGAGASLTECHPDITVLSSLDYADTDVIAAMKTSRRVIIADTEDYSSLLIKGATLNGLNVMRVSINPDVKGYGDNDAWVERIVERPDCSCVVAHVAGERMTYKIGMPGKQAVLNSLLSLAAIKAAGGDMAMTALTFASCQARAGRGREIVIGDEGQSFTVVDYTDGMNVFSLRAALDHFRLIETGKYCRRTAVLGDFDAGTDIDESYGDALQKQLVDAGITRVLTTGSGMASLTRAAGILTEEFQTNRALKSRLQSMARAGDAALIMGSVSAGLTTIIDELTAQHKTINDTVQVAAE